MITTVSTTALLNAALKVAQGGDTILLEPGVYTGVVASGLNYAQGVTVTSATPDTLATLTRLNVTASSNLTFQGLEFRVDAAAGDNPFLIAKSHDVTLTGLSVHGSLDGDPQNDRAAMLVRDSSHVTVADSTFQQLWIGLGQLNDDHLTIQGNTFKEIQMDGIRGGGSSFVTVTGNSFSSFHPKPADHPDAIQFWTSGTTASAHDIAITDNVFLRGTGTGVLPQGVFLNDEVGTLPYQHVTITGNLVAGAGYNGIAVFHGQDVTVSDNIVVGFLDYKSWIRLVNVDNGTLSNNQTTLISLTGDTNLVQTNNTIVAQVSDGGAAYLAAWQAAHGGSGLPTFNGTPGADTLVGTAGADILNGGLGDDVYVVNASGDTVVEAVGAGNDLVQSALSYTLAANVERLTLTGAAAVDGYGNALANVLSGNAAGNLLSGGAGGDTLNGGAGDDTLQGGDGADKLVGGLGGDRIGGGAGDDYYVIDDVRDLAVETVAGAAGGYDYVASSVSYTLGANLERLALSGAGALDGTGNELANLITGGAGANHIYGLAGADTLSGLDGADTLDGGADADLLTGGAGADRFVFARGEANGDRVQDFAAGDHIDLVGYSVGSTISAVAGSATAWMIHDAATRADETIQLLNGYRLTTGDFMFA